MGTVKLDISTGLKYSPNEGTECVTKLHNFIVGENGALYKMPALENLKETKGQLIAEEPAGNPPLSFLLNYRLLDIKKLEMGGEQREVEETFPGSSTKPAIYNVDTFHRYIYLTAGSYGVINISTNGPLVPTVTTKPERYNAFEYDVFDYKPDGGTDKIDLYSLNSRILADQNAAIYYTATYASNFPDYAAETAEYPRVFFPTQHMFQDLETDYKSMFFPRNCIHSSLKTDLSSPDVLPLMVANSDGEPNSGSEKEANDLVRGVATIGNRMVYYSTQDHRLYLSKANNFTLVDYDSSDALGYGISPTEAIQGITDFNGNILTFLPSGIERWVLSSSNDVILQRDPTFHYDHRLRFGGSFQVANRDLYFYTDDFQAYRMSSSFQVEQIFKGVLPQYEPYKSYLNRNDDQPLAYFKMLGYRFVSFGPWLYNIDTNTWSTYAYDGYLSKEPAGGEYTYPWENDTTKKCISTGVDDIVCTYSTICRPLSYEEMQTNNGFSEQTTPTCTAEEFQWGQVACFTTEQLRDEKTFSLDGVYVLVSSGLLEKEAKIWMQVLLGDDEGTFTEGDENTYGIPSYYRPSDKDKNTGRFFWRLNQKTDRFRLQFITTEKKGIIIEAVLAKIVKPEEAEQGTAMQGQKG